MSIKLKFLFFEIFFKKENSLRDLSEIILLRLFKILENKNSLALNIFSWFYDNQDGPG